MKKIVIVLVLCLLATSLVSAAPKRKAAPLNAFLMGDLTVTPQIGLTSGYTPVGANVEYGLTDNIGIGGTAMFWFASGVTVIIPSLEAAYHFTQLDVENLDVSAGGGLGYAIYSSEWGSGTSSIYPFLLLNGRYYFSPKLAANFRLDVGFGDYSGSVAMIGVTLKL